MSALPSSPARSLILAATTALAGAVAVLGLPASGAAALTGSPSAPVVEAMAEAREQGRSLPALPTGEADAAPAHAGAATAGTTAVPAHTAPRGDLLRRQVEAGLDCELTAGRLVVCAHGDDAEPALRDAVHPHQTATAGAGTVHGSGGSATGSSGSIGCYGDGNDGPRVRAIYARPQSAADGYSAAVSSIRGWAAGVSKHFDTSAARTGGRRHVRFATTRGAGCSVTVLNVALPDSAFDSFTATINALEARGFDAPGSKYLVWADATGYCGVATMYADDKPGLDNLNNGAFPNYARVDRRCWGKVETHEVVHMLGGVQRSAPNSTDGGHCSDGTDLMCYADGTARSTQRAVCGNENAEILDCRNDDYFSTAAPRGSYLQTHWNTARSSFLSEVLSDPAPSAGAKPAASPTPSPAASPSPSAVPPTTGGLAPELPLPIPLPTLAAKPASVLSAPR